MALPSGRLVLGLALDGAGSHPAVTPTVGELFDPGRLRALALRAEGAGLDFVSLDDGFDASDLPAARPDALLTAAFLAAATTTLGVLATTDVTHTEPFHLSKNLATLDHVGLGRGAWRPRTSASVAATAAFGRRDPVLLTPLALAAEEADAIEVVRQLWDSWEDGAVIRDTVTDRYLDGSKVHKVAFEGDFFSVLGPSITPRPPQGQLPVFLDAADEATAQRAAGIADVVLVHGSIAEAAALVTAARSVERAGDPARVLVVLRSDDAAALEAAAATTGADGFLLVPDDLPSALDRLPAVVAALHERGLHAPPATGSTLRDRLALPRPENRYAGATA